MADIAVDSFGEQDRTESRTDEPMDECIPLIPGGGRSTWEPTHEQEMSFGGESQRTSLMKDYVKDFYKMLSKKLVKSQNHFTMIISNLKVGNYTT